MKRVTYLTTLAVSLALAAGTNAAIGSTRPDDRATHGPGATTLAQSTDVTRPDDRATHGPGAIEFVQVTPVGQVPVVAPASASVRVDGFDWLDAGIGAAAVLGLGLVVAGGVAFVVRRAQAPAYS